MAPTAAAGVTNSRARPEARYAEDGATGAAAGGNRARVVPDVGETDATDSTPLSSTPQCCFFQKQRRKNQADAEFIARHGKEKAAKLRSELNAFKRANQKYTQNKWVLHPEKNRALARWDIITSIALLWTATITPFETSFLPAVAGSRAWTDTWFLSNRVLDGIFLFDMCLQFFVTYQIADAYGGLTWIDDQQLIVKHYLTTWFALDFGTVAVPMTFDIMLASSDVQDVATGGEDSAEFAERMGLFRVLRVLRLIKLVRLVRASRLFARWQSAITLNYASQTVIKCAFMLFVSSHWFACIIALQAQLHENIEHTWLGAEAYGLCVPWTLTQGQQSSNPVVRRVLQEQPLGACPNLSVSSLYLAAFSWSVMVITGTGGTDFYPSAASDGETLVVLVLVLIGAFLWTFVLAAFCDVATNSNPAMVAFHQNIDGLNLFIKMNTLPKGMAKRMRLYMHQQRGSMLRENAKQTLPQLSAALQVEAVMHVHKYWLDAIWFIRDLDAPVKVRCAMAMAPKILAPSELAPNRHLYVVMRGSVMYGKRMLTRGLAWGDDIILSDPNYFLPFLARALYYTDVTFISRETLYEHVDLYPRSRAKLRRWTIHLAIRRHLIFEARQAKAAHNSMQAKRNRGNASSLLDMTYRNDFLERIHEAQEKNANAHVSDAEEQSYNIALELNKAASTASVKSAGGEAAPFELTAMRSEMGELKAGLKQLHNEMAAIRIGQETLASSVAAGAEMMRELVSGAQRAGLFGAESEDQQAQ